MNLETILAENDTVLVDVREPYEFESGHVDKAINIPLSRLHLHVDELRAKNKTIVLYCQSGNRSGRAKNLLVQNHCVQVYNGGGINDIKIMLHQAKP